MMFDIEYSNLSKKFLKKIDKELASRILDKLEGLKTEPIPSDSKFIGRENNEKAFRIRIGKYRAVYKLKQLEKVILVTKIDKRGKVYG